VFEREREGVGGGMGERKRGGGGWGGRMGGRQRGGGETEKESLLGGKRTKKTFKNSSSASRCICEVPAPAPANLIQLNSPASIRLSVLSSQGLPSLPS